jgi:kynurenine formamidase
MPLPSYADLPPAPLGGRSAWAVFGADDQIGTLNLLTAERVLAASRLVRRGAMFPLDVPLGTFAPALSLRRSPPRHSLVHVPGTWNFDDVFDNFWPQGASQWDSLAHVGYHADAFYNGATEAEILAGARNTIDHAAAHGVAGRGVLVDVERSMRERGVSYDPGSTHPLHVADLEAALELSAVDLGEGDILFLYTGFTAWYRAQELATRIVMPPKLTTPGLAHEEEVCAWLWDRHIAAIVSDNFAIEVWPREPDKAPFDDLHRILIGQFGLTLGELWHLSDLAADCAADGCYEFFVTAAPLHARGGIGSPANALAIK